MRKKMNLWQPSTGNSPKKPKTSTYESLLQQPYTSPPKKHPTSLKEPKSSPSPKKAKIEDSEQLERLERPTLKRHQRRRNTLSISVSIEEEEILKQAAYKAGLNFSAWARQVLFSKAGKKIPKRPR